MVLLLFFMIRKGAHMYSDRQTELSIFLEQLQQSAEEKTEERVIIHAVTKAGGEKIFEIERTHCLPQWYVWKHPAQTMEFLNNRKQAKKR